jgi:hypothetical protein
VELVVMVGRQLLQQYQTEVMEPLEQMLAVAEVAEALQVELLLRLLAAAQVVLVVLALLLFITRTNYVCNS